MRFAGEVWYWRGPAPFHFVTVPDPEAAEIATLAAEVTYGWGMIPARCRLGDTSWETSLWPKDGGYVVPVKTAVRKAEQVDVGDTVTIDLEVVAAHR